MGGRESYGGLTEADCRGNVECSAAELTLEGLADEDGRPLHFLTGIESFLPKAPRAMVDCVESMGAVDIHVRINPPALT